MSCLNFIPSILANNEEAKNILKSYDDEVSKIKALRLAVVNNQYFNSLDADGCYKWEEIYGIAHDLTKSVSERRELIKARAAFIAPITKSTLQEILDYLYGTGEFTIYTQGDSYYGIPIPPYIIVVVAEDEERHTDLEELVREYIPSHILDSYAYKYTHLYLEKYTHQGIVDNVVPPTHAELSKYNFNTNQYVRINGTEYTDLNTHTYEEIEGGL